MSLRTTLSDAAVDYVRACGGPTAIEAVIDHLMEVYGPELEAEGNRAMRDFVRNAARAGLQDKAPGADRQPLLPGFRLPATITVPVNDGGIVYVATEAATREQAHAHTLVKESNIAAAVKEHRDWIEFLDQADAVWASNPEFTLGQCIAHLREVAA